MSKGTETNFQIPKSDSYPYLAWHNPGEDAEPQDDAHIILISEIQGVGRIQCANLMTGACYLSDRENEYTRLPVGSVFTITQK